MSDSIALETTPSQSQSVRKLDDDGPWDIGTKVYNNFPNEGWWSGSITAYSEATGMYTVTWEDGSTDYYDDGDKIDEMVAYAQNDPQNNPAGGTTGQSGSYPSGTAVALFEEGEWYEGVVVKFGSGTYTVKWNEDGEIEEIQAGAIMNQMVQDAMGDDDAPPSGYEGGPSPAVAVGTAVSVFENGQWSDGTVTHYAENSYTVKWENGDIDRYDDSGSDLVELKKAVEDAKGDDDAPPSEKNTGPASGPSFPMGTPLSDFEDGEWIDGKVVNFDEGSYVVAWEDEDQVEYYASSNAEDMQQLTQMKANANGDDDAPPASYFAEEDLWQVGTPVAITEDDTLWYGKIDGFSHGEYSIAWDSGEAEWLDNFDLVNQMVSNAAISPKRSGMSAVGKTFLSLFLISIGLAGSVFGYKFYEQRQAQAKRDSELDEDDGSRIYRDEPDHLPKII